MLTIEEVRRLRRGEPWAELLRGERIGMVQVGVEGHDERWAAVDESHARMGTAVNSVFVALWIAEESLDVEIVAREGRVVPSDEETLFE